MAEACWDRKGELESRHYPNIRRVLNTPERAGIRACVAGAVRAAYKELTKNDA